MSKKVIKDYSLNIMSGQISEFLLDLKDVGGYAVDIAISLQYVPAKVIIKVALPEGQGFAKYDNFEVFCN